MWGLPLSQGSAPRTLSAGESSITSGFNRKVPGRNQREFLESKLAIAAQFGVATGTVQRIAGDM
jgi:hypothetical protein